MIQTLVSEDKRGRVMSYYTMAFVGMAPFGSLLAGWMANLMRRALDGDHEWRVVVLGAVWFFTRLPALRVVVRPIYQEMGIIPAAQEIVAEQ